MKLAIAVLALVGCADTGKAAELEARLGKLDARVEVLEHAPKLEPRWWCYDQVCSLTRADCDSSRDHIIGAFGSARNPRICEQQLQAFCFEQVSGHFDPKLCYDAMKTCSGSRDAIAKLVRDAKESFRVTVDCHAE